MCTGQKRGSKAAVLATGAKAYLMLTYIRLQIQRQTLCVDHERCP
jgi:hypothetical protein